MHSKNERVLKNVIYKIVEKPYLKGKKFAQFQSDFKILLKAIK